MKDETSYVYYIQLGDLLKIGVSRAPAQRLREFQISCPLLELAAIEEGSYELERQRHEQFDACRFGFGEWFRMSSEIEAHIKTLSPEYDWQIARRIAINAIDSKAKRKRV